MGLSFLVKKLDSAVAFSQKMGGNSSRRRADGDHSPREQYVRAWLKPTKNRGVAGNGHIPGEAIGWAGFCLRRRGRIDSGCDWEDVTHLYNEFRYPSVELSNPMPPNLLRNKMTCRRFTIIVKK
ncbi:MAG: hypothetical protein JSS02_34635 [Planctomycetes bacterium]|nr:hypothetical protein [Planctomycetota bacterium]